MFLGIRKESAMAGLEQGEHKAARLRLSFSFEVWTVVMVSQHLLTREWGGPPMAADIDGS